MPATLAPSLIEELESAMVSGSVQRRTDVMRRVTDLFINSSGSLSEDQIRLFGDVIAHLISHIESRALAELSSRLAPMAKAPIGVIRRFAHDDSIEISGPVLAQSELLTDDDLVEIAGTKTQAHLARIATRTHLSEAVTDVLVERGDLEVATEVAANRGAQFSDSGLSKLISMADGNDRLTETVGLRPDIPPKLFRELLAHATAAARQRLMASAKPEAREAMEKILADLGAQLGGKGRGQRDLAEIQRLTSSLGGDTELIRAQLPAFADAHRMVEVVAALSVLSGVRAELVDRLIRATSVYGTMVLCRAISLDWPTARVVIRARPGVGRSRSADLQDAHQEYAKLSPLSAQRLLRFWQVRQNVA